MAGFLTKKQLAIASKSEKGRKLIKDLPNITQEQTKSRFENDVLAQHAGVKPETVPMPTEKAGAQPMEQPMANKPMANPNEAPKAPQAPQPTQGGGIEVVRKIFDVIYPIAKQNGWIK